MALHKIIIITEVPILEPVIKGGAQRILYDTYRALKMQSQTCLVYHHQPRLSETEKHYICKSLHGHEKIKHHSFSRKNLLKNLENADLIISVDKFFDMLPQGHHNILSLSNLAYKAEKEAALNLNWDRFWVVSPFLRDQLLQHSRISESVVDIIEPTIPRKQQHFKHLEEIQKQLEAVKKVVK